MAQDFYIDYLDDGDLRLDNGQLRLTNTNQELVRQRVEITLRAFRGEWFANVLFGVPYFQSILVKTTKEAVDTILKDTILSVEGVVNIFDFESTLDSSTRKYTMSFRSEIIGGDIIESSLEI